MFLPEGKMPSGQPARPALQARAPALHFVSRAGVPGPQLPAMIPALRLAFNSNYKPEKYGALLRELENRCGVPIGFRVSETPCFFPKTLIERLAEDGKALIHQLVDSPEYHERSNASIPPAFCAARE